MDKKNARKMGKKKGQNKRATNTSSNVPTSQLSWEDAIKEAERKIRLHKEAIIRLKTSIRFFKEQIESGEPFPGQ